MFVKRHGNSSVVAAQTQDDQKQVNGRSVAILIVFLVLLLIGPFCCAQYLRYRQRKQIVAPPRAHSEACRQVLSLSTQWTTSGHGVAECIACPICHGVLGPSPSPDEFLHPTSEILHATSAKEVARNIRALCRWRLNSFRTVAPKRQDAILLITCKHAFHLSCLTSWFLLNRYDCPMCRRLYTLPVRNDSI